MPKRDPDLRILALLEGKFLPPEVLHPFDRWRIWRARDGVASLVRRRLIDDPMLRLMLERLEVADDESGIFEGIYALAQVVDMHRGKMGINAHNVVLTMAVHLNPWGLVTLNPDYDSPSKNAVECATELWRLSDAEGLDIETLLVMVADDPIVEALTRYYAQPEGASDLGTDE